MTTPAKSIPALPAPTSVAAVINRIIAVAGSQVGYREGHNSSGWNNDNAYGKWYGMNGESWCAMFVSWSAANAGIPESVILKHAYTPTGLNWFKAKGEAVSKPARGDIFYVYSASMGRVHHVGIVESVGGNAVHTIEGNTNTNGSAQGDGVYRLTRTISSNLKFVRPDYAACVKAAPGGSVGAKPGELISLSALAYAATGGYFHVGQAPAKADAEIVAAWIKRLGIATDRDVRVWATFVRQANWKSAGLQYAGIIRKFQHKYGLQVDGVVGTATKAKLRDLLAHDNYRVVA